MSDKHPCCKHVVESH